MDESVVYPLYIVVKYVAYCLWSYYGLKLLRNQSGIGSAVGFGSARLGLGMLFGISVFFVGATLHLHVPAHPWTLYLSIYVPLRYVDWTILAALLTASVLVLHVALSFPRPAIAQAFPLASAGALLLQPRLLLLMFLVFLYVGTEFSIWSWTVSKTIKASGCWTSKRKWTSGGHGLFVSKEAKTDW